MAMQDFPEYNSTVGVEVGSGQSPMAQADQMRANLYQNVAQKTSGIAQKSEDILQEREGAKDAQKQGIGWTPKSDLTEAGRAYNQQGQQIATNIGTSQLIGRVNNIYNTTMNSPVGSGGVQSFKQASDSYFQQTLNSADPSMRPALSRAYNSVLLSDGNQIARREGKYQRSKSIASLNSTHQDLSNQAGNMMAQSYGMTDPVMRDLTQKEAYNTLVKSKQAAQQSAVLSGNLQQANSYIRKANLNYLNASIVGRMKGLMTFYDSTTDPVQKDLIGNQIKSFPQNFAQDSNLAGVYKQVSLDDNMSANEQFKTTRELNRLSSSFGTQIQSNKQQDLLTANNALIAHGNGKPIPAEIDSMMQTQYPNQYPKWHDNVMAAGSSYQMYNDYTSRGIGSINGFINKYSNPTTPLDIPGLSDTANQKVKTQLLTKFKSYASEYKKDPYSITAQSPEFNNYLSKQYTSLHSTNPGISDQQLQTELSNAVNNPIVNFQSPRTAVAKQSLNDVNTHIKQIQISKGLTANQSIMTNRSANMIVDNLNGEDPAQRVQSLLTAKNNYGQHWGDVQRSLINTKKLPYTDLIAMHLHDSPNPGTTVVDMLSATDATRQDSSKYWTQLGTTQNEAYKDVLGDKTVMNAMKSFQAYPGEQSKRAVDGIVQAIANVASTRLNRNGSQWQNDGSVVEQAAKDVIGGLYQKNASDGYRVPYNVEIKNPSGGMISRPVDYDTVQNVMKYMKQDANNSAVSYGGRVSAHGSKWINTPDGSGMVMVDSNNKPFYFKNKKPYGFSFAQAANPGTLPQGYHDYMNESWVKRWL